MAIRKAVRIYDLARELKQDTKRVMEDLRRVGADVSVASNSVSAEFAEKVRLKYFPKTDVAPKRALKIIKAVKKGDDAHTDEAIHTTDAPVAAEETSKTPVVKTAEPPVAEAVATTLDEAPKTPTVKKLVATKTDEPVAEPAIRVTKTLKKKVDAHRISSQARVDKGLLGPDRARSLSTNRVQDSEPPSIHQRKAWSTHRQSEYGRSLGRRLR